MRDTEMQEVQTLCGSCRTLMGTEWRAAPSDARRRAPMQPLVQWDTCMPCRTGGKGSGPRRPGRLREVVRPTSEGQIANGH